MPAHRGRELAGPDWIDLSELGEPPEPGDAYNRELLCGQVLEQLRDSVGAAHGLALSGRGQANSSTSAAE
jgi:hypothetical protein